MKLASPELQPYASTEARVESARLALGWTMPHSDFFPEPHYLVEGSLQLPHLMMLTGTLFVTGDLAVGVLDVQRCGRQLTNIVVGGSCKLGTAYLDGFLVVRGALDVGTFVGDTTWDGGLFVGGELTGDTLILDDMGLELDGELRVKLHCDICERPAAAREALPALYDDDECVPRTYFLSLAQR